jgi:CheY-like chemotaxis protein
VATVLLVENRQDDRVMYAEYLRLRGFDVIESDSTDEALTQVAHAQVVVTSVRLSGSFDGVELVRRLRADSASSDKPLIVLTASAYGVDQQRATESGCDAVLLKPCLPDALERVIKRTLRLRAVRGRSRKAQRRQRLQPKRRT